MRQWAGHQLSKSRNCARDQLSDDDDDGDDDDGDDGDDDDDTDDDNWGWRNSEWDTNLNETSVRKSRDGQM